MAAVRPGTEQLTAAPRDNPPSPPSPPVPAPAGGVHLRFGIVLDIAQTTVPISTSDIGGGIKNAKTNGIDFTLPQPITLPSFKQFSQWVSQKWNVTIPDAGSLPAPLDQVVNAIEDVNITIRLLHVKVPPDKSGAKITLEVDAVFATEVPLIPDVLGIKGLVFGFANEDWPPPQAPAAA